MLFLWVHTTFLIKWKVWRSFTYIKVDRNIILAANFLFCKLDYSFQVFNSEHWSLRYTSQSFLFLQKQLYCSQHRKISKWYWWILLHIIEKAVYAAINGFHIPQFHALIRKTERHCNIHFSQISLRPLTYATALMKHQIIISSVFVGAFIFLTKHLRAGHSLKYQTTLITLVSLRECLQTQAFQNDNGRTIIIMSTVMFINSGNN